jgi:cell division protein FtsB
MKNIRQKFVVERGKKWNGDATVTECEYRVSYKKELRKLKRRVKELEADVEQLKRGPTTTRQKISLLGR